MKVEESNIEAPVTAEGIQKEADDSVKEVLESASPENTTAELAAKAMRAGIEVEGKDKQAIGETIDEALKGKPVEGISEATNATTEDLGELEEAKPQSEIIAPSSDQIAAIQHNKEITELVQDIEKMFRGLAKVSIVDKRDKDGVGEYSINFTGGPRQSECISLTSSRQTILMQARSYIGRSFLGANNQVSM